MRGTSAEETLCAEKVYERLEATHGAGVCGYRVDSRSFADLLFKETVQTRRQQISYCGVGFLHQNAIF